MRKLLILLLSISLSGCFVDEAKMPQFYAQQEIDVAVDSVICYSGYESFDHFILNCSLPFDSLHWYGGSSTAAFLGSGQPINIPKDPYSIAAVRCIGFSDSDTTIFDLQLNYCGRHIYIPTAFNPWFGVNAKWKPIVNAGGSEYFIYWELRTLEGATIFKTSEQNHPGWDGGYNGYRMPNGAYLYYIELTIGGETVEYTGWFEKLG